MLSWPTNLCASEMAPYSLYRAHRLWSKVVHCHYIGNRLPFLDTSNVKFSQVALRIQDRKWKLLFLHFCLNDFVPQDSRWMAEFYIMSVCHLGFVKVSTPTCSKFRLKGRSCYEPRDDKHFKQVKWLLYQSEKHFNCFVNCILLWNVTKKLLAPSSSLLSPPPPLSAAHTSP